MSPIGQMVTIVHEPELSWTVTPNAVFRADGGMKDGPHT